MFINGLHLVQEVRERVADGASHADVEVFLSRESENGSSIVVAFTAANKVTLTLIGSRPFLGVQYSLPRAELDLFLKRFPVGTLVTSSLAIPAKGPKTLKLQRFADESVTIRDADLRDFFSEGTAPNKGTPVMPLALDNKFVHVWTSGARNYEFKADGGYYVLESLDYQLLDSGMRLDWGGMLFDRLSGDPAQVAGHWLSVAGDEDVLLRADGTYTWHTVGELPDAVGTWAISGSKIDSAELRADCSTSGSEITFDAVYSGTYVGDFAFSNGDKTLTISFDGVPVVYTRP